MKKLSLILVLFLATGPNLAVADVLVLVHGYLGTAKSWAEAGAMARLHQRGYRHVGELGYGPSGVVFQPTGQKSQQPMYTVGLPSQAPVVIQADWLAAQLREIRKRHPDEAVKLASAAFTRHVGTGCGVYSKRTIAGLPVN